MLRALILGFLVIPAAAAAATPDAHLPAKFIGSWSFDGTCHPSDLLQLRADGSASLQDGFVGTWRSTRDGRIVMDLHPADDVPGVAAGEAERFEYRRAKRVPRGLQITVEGRHRITLADCNQPN